MEVKMKPVFLPNRVLCLVSMLVAFCLVISCGNDDQETAPSSTEISAPTTQETPATSPDTPVTDELVTYTEDREPCDCRNQNRNLYWGELHAHTVLSYDAYGWGTVVTQEEAYQFAKGGTIALTVRGSDVTQHVKLSRPLDFAALTDHQEYLSETYLCTHPDSGAYDCELCRQFRENVGTMGFLQWSFNLSQNPGSHLEEICQSPGVDCEQIAAQVWESIIHNAQEAYDRTSDCTFTAFPAYEYTLSPNLSNKHRNIIFRNTDLPDMPPSSFEQSHERDLWAELIETCLDEGNDCDFIAIPHNSNWSNGHMFMIDYPEGSSLDQQREMAAQRASMEPLVEITQHKGSMECRNGFEGIEDDPLCDFEKIRNENTQECDTPGEGGMAGSGCISRYDYIRNVLKLGLSEWLRLGINPYKIGIVGGTDTHNGIPSKTEEYDFPGHMGITDDTPEKRLSYDPVLPSFSIYNPGAITAVWAVENSRDALFDAMRQRETYATTGPRITVRFFGGWDFSERIFEDEDFVTVCYAQGVPMGSDLPAKPENVQAPQFVVMAEKDPGVKGHPGTDLQQIQIIKGWIDAQGNEREKVFTIAGDASNGADVDPETCRPTGEGWERLNTIWTDPEFNPSLPAFYYMRVVENPSCRWLQYECNQFADGQAPQSCSDSRVKKIIQERAVTSAIWYEPEN